MSLPAAGPLAANSEWLGEVTAVGRKDPVWGRVAQSGRGITEGGRACVPPSCRAKKGQASVQPSSSSQQGCQALHSCHHTASPQPRGDMWPPSARVAGGEVTLEPGGHHTTVRVHTSLCQVQGSAPSPAMGLSLVLGFRAQQVEKDGARLPKHHAWAVGKPDVIRWQQLRESWKPSWRRWPSRWGSTGVYARGEPRMSTEVGRWW